MGAALSLAVNRWRRNVCESLSHLEESGADRRGGHPLQVLLPTVAERLHFHQEQSQHHLQQKVDLETRFQVRNKRLQRAEAALHALESPVLIADSRGDVVFANRVAEVLLTKLYGTSNGTDGAALRDKYGACAELKGLVEETCARNAASDRRVAEFTWADNPGTMSYRATAENVYDADGALLGVAALLYDICDVTRARTRHVEFVASVSHEMKTPMAGIKAYLEMLMDGEIEDPQEARELYGFIDGQIDRLTRLVDNMLNLARIESGVIKVQRHDCELNEILQRAAGVVRPVSEEKEQSLVCELSDMYLPVHVDPDLVGQAVINLLSNAVKYSPGGGEVRLRSRMDDNCGIIEVRDTGMGIPADSLERLFDRFYRVPENTSAAAGTGLGLALVQHIITDIHGGHVRVESEVGVGSCFTIEIPLGHRDRGRRKSSAALCASR